MYCVKLMCMYVEYLLDVLYNINVYVCGVPSGCTV